MLSAIRQHESARGVRVPPPQSGTPLPLPPHPTPLGGPRAVALGALLHASKLHWSSVLHVVLSLFQSYSLKASQRSPWRELSITARKHTHLSSKPWPCLSRTFVWDVGGSKNRVQRRGNVLQIFPQSLGKSSHFRQC